MDNDFIPVGAILMHCSNTIPNNWLVCDGATFSSANYPKLAEVLLNNYGPISGTDYKLPDFRGRIPVSNVDTAVNSHRRVGAESVTLTALQTGVNSHTHAHTLTAGAHGHGFTIANRFRGGQSSFTSSNTSGTGGSQRTFSTTNSIYGNVAIAPALTVNSNTAGAAASPHNNVMPYLGVNFIIKAN